MRKNEERFELNENMAVKNLRNVLKEIIKKEGSGEEVAELIDRAKSIIAENIKVADFGHKKAQKRFEKQGNPRKVKKLGRLNTKLKQLEDKIPRDYWKNFDAEEILNAVEEVYFENNKKEKDDIVPVGDVQKVVHGKVYKQILPSVNPAKKSIQVDKGSMAEVQAKSKIEEAAHQERKITNPKWMGNEKIGVRKGRRKFLEGVENIKRDLNRTYGINSLTGL